MPANAVKRSKKLQVMLHVRRVLKCSEENLVEHMSSRCECELTGRLFVRNVVHEAYWKAQDDPNTTWNKIVSCIKRVVRDVLGELRGGAPPCKNISWWNEEVKAAIKIKRDSYRDLKKNCDVVSFERYKLAKKGAKKVV